MTRKLVTAKTPQNAIERVQLEKIAQASPPATQMAIRATLHAVPKAAKPAAPAKVFSATPRKATRKK